MEKYRDVVLKGAAGTRAQGEAAEVSAEQQKKLNEQYRKFLDLSREFASRGNPERAAFEQLLADYRKVDQEITAKGAEWDARRNQLKIAALMSYLDKEKELKAKRAEEERKQLDEADRISDDIEKHRVDSIAKVDGEGIRFFAHQAELEANYTRIVEEGARKREEARQKEISQALSAAGAIEQTIGLASKGKLSPQLGVDALARMPQTIAALQKQLEHSTFQAPGDRGKNRRSHPAPKRTRTPYQTELDHRSRRRWKACGRPCNRSLSKGLRPLPPFLPTW